MHGGLHELLVMSRCIYCIIHLYNIAALLKSKSNISNWLLERTGCSLMFNCSLQNPTMDTFNNETVYAKVKTKNITTNGFTFTMWE